MSQGIATIPQVLFYNDTSGHQISSPMANIALLEGLIQTKTNLSAVAPFCSTGNCTWPEYSSLGICSNVEDISSTIINNDCNITDFEEIFQVAGITNPGYPCFNYSLPELIFADSLESTKNITLSNGDATWGLVDQLGLMQILTLASTLRDTSSLYTASLMYQPDLLTSINSSLSSPVAYSIALDLCIQTYQSTTSNGITNTTISSSQLLPLNSKKILGNNGLSINLTGDVVDMMSVGNDTFGITQGGIADLTLSIEGFFSDSCFEIIPDGQIDSLYTQSGASDYCLFTSGEPFLNLLSNSTNKLPALIEKMQNIATSLTNT